MDLPVSYDDIRDEIVLETGGNTSKVKTVRFRLGKFGPFTERVPNDENWQLELNRRIDTLRRNLNGLAT